MGLDSIELIVTLEEKFGIEIPNEDAAKLAVLGDLHSYVVRALQRRGEKPDEAAIWESIKETVVELLCVRPERVTRSAHVVLDLGAA